MFDAPPPPPPAETAIVQIVDNQYITEEIIQNTVNQTVAEIKTVFADGFQWTDLGELGALAYRSVNKYLALPEAMKMEAIIQIINDIIACIAITHDSLNCAGKDQCLLVKIRIVHGKAEESKNFLL